MSDGNGQTKKPLVVFINVFGPVDHPQHGRVHEIELGCGYEGATIDAGKFMVKTETTSEAIISAAGAAAKFVATYGDAQGKPKADIVALPLTKR